MPRTFAIHTRITAPLLLVIAYFVFRLPDPADAGSMEILVALIAIPALMLLVATSLESLVFTPAAAKVDRALAEELDGETRRFDAAAVAVQTAEEAIKRAVKAAEEERDNGPATEPMLITHEFQPVSGELSYWGGDLYQAALADWSDRDAYPKLGGRHERTETIPAVSE